MKTYELNHAGCNYSLSLDWLETRKMEPLEASQHICTDQIMLFDGKRVSDIKSEYKEYQANGGDLRKKEYLDKVVNEQIPGATWDQAISYSKQKMRKIFFHGETNGWITKEDHWELSRLAQCGHAVAAYNLGCQFMKQEDDLAVRALVNAHNFGHVGALYRLSGYLARKDNFLGAIVCLVISADCGFDLAVMAIPQIEILEYIRKSLDGHGYREIELLADKIADTRPHSSARYLQVMTSLISKNNRCIRIIEDIEKQPMRKPKANEIDETYLNRESILRQFFGEVKNAISDQSNTSLRGGNTGELLKIYKEISNRERYHFVPYKDFMEVDSLINL